MLVQTREFKVTPPSLLFDPTFFPFDFTTNGEFTKFLVVDEATLELAPFIDIRFEPLAKAQFWVDSAELFTLESRHDVPRARPAFIFHHAFVCSTLLAKCLGCSDAFFSLKEPWTLRRLADLKRAHGSLAASPQWHDTVRNHVRLMCRNFVTGRMPLIKATNVANNLLPEVLQGMPGSPVLYLHSGLESFLVSNLKKTADTQRKIPALANGFLGDCDFLQKHPELADTSRLGFLQVCALVWLVSLYNLRECMTKFPDARIRTLDVEAFLGDPSRSLDQVSRHFGHAPEPADLQRMVDSRIMRTNAKDPSAPYGKEQRQSEMDQIRSRHGRELQDAMSWLEPWASQLQLAEFVHSHRLIGE